MTKNKKQSKRNRVLLVSFMAIALVLLAGILILTYFSPLGENWRLRQQADDFVGLTLDEAKAKASEEGLRYRVVKENGKGSVITGDFVPKRINFSVENNKIVGAEFDQQLANQ